ncbi:hypothetical protein HHK36_003469 [Tetracentron sinense]|uniref:Uncharacterized protein n=1 Tax=Tetracentron sinense TaxID=13715 RepID=A0A834ZYC9_TETSI|nr:hypothetical protein HHK36_003469 [Tetracentron sinense]
MTGMDISYEFPHATTPTIPEWVVGPMKFDLGNSPNSPLLTHFDCDTFSTLSNSEEQFSSTENLSGVSPSYNSPLEINSTFHRVSPSPSHLQDCLQLFSSGSSVSQDANCCQSMKYALLKLETALMGPDIEEDEVTTPNTAFEWNKQQLIPNQRSRAWSQKPCVIKPQPSFVSMYQKSSQAYTEQHHRVMEATSQEIPQVDLKILLIECARALFENRINDFEKLVKEARNAVSICGEPIQRLGAYMVEGLVARKEASGTNIYRANAMRCKEPESRDLLSYMQILYEICPYLKFGYMAANGAIAEAFKDEDRVHIIDFQIGQGIQWMTLIQALAARPNGPPHVRITGRYDPVSKYACGDSLEAVGNRLAEMSRKFNIPVEFHAVPVYMPDVTREMLDVRPGEALAVNFTLQLHHTPDESVDVNNPRDGLLRMVKSLSPKVMTLVEQESNTNTTPFFTRFLEALDFYSAMFESIDVTLPRDRKERINVEQHCLARDIVNIIACEGKERVERHELLGKWKSRLTMAGFQSFHLSSYVNSVIKGLMGYYSEHYTLVETDGAMLLGWKNRNLISASAWH